MPARLVPLAMGRTAVAVSGLADSGLVHRLTRGRLWIGALTTLLVGIVSLNVLALSFNASSSGVGRQADALKREISALRAKIVTTGTSDERVQAAAASLGLIAPEAGSIRYLRSSANDPAVAAGRLTSGELTAQSSYAAPSAPVTAPATAPSPPPATDPTAIATQPSQDAPAAGATGTTTVGATSPQTAPAGGEAGGGVASGGGGGVATP